MLTDRGRSTTTRLILAAAFPLAAFTSACETASPASPGAPTGSDAVQPTIPLPEPAELRVAFVQDVSPEGALALTTPAFQAAELAFAVASLPAGVSIELVPYETEGDEGRIEEIAAEVAGDEAFVAAIAAPGLASQRSLAERLGAADVPLVSLSARGTVEDPPPGTWMRLVAPIDVQASALADAAAGASSRDRVCLASGPPDGSTYARRVQAGLERDVTVVQVGPPTRQELSGCRVVVWTGDAEGGVALASVLAGLDDPTTLIGGPALRESTFLEEAGGEAEGAVSLCSCADVSTSLDLAAQRFVQDYQAEYGSSPGPYAVEAWDAARLVVRGLREAGPDRAAVGAWLASLDEAEGLGGTYVLERGELVRPASYVRTYRLDGGRWIERPEPT